jgi:hypothetical protein
MRNPGCDGFVYFEDANLKFHIAFSTLDLPHWREAVTASRDLIRQWEWKGHRGHSQRLWRV